MIFFLGIALLGAAMLGISMFAGEAEAGDVDGDGGADISDGPSLFNLKTIALFMVGTGATGAIASLYVGVGWLSWALGLGAGVALGSGGYQVLKLVYRQQASSLIDDGDFLGQEGRVVEAIPKGGIGQASVEVRAKRVYRKARAKDGKEIKAGSAVYVVEMQGGVLVVEPLKALQENR